MIRFTKSAVLTLSAVLAGAMAMEASAQQTVAQRKEKIQQAMKEAYRVTVRNGSAKTAAVKHRLVGSAYKYTDGTIVETSDSTRNVYSGTRGAINLDPVIYDSYIPYEQPDFDQSKMYTNDGSGWKQIEQYDQTFDANDKMLSSVNQNAYNGLMTNSYRLRYTNNAQGILQEAFSDGWGGAAWDEETRDVFRYTAGGQLDSVLNYEYDGSQWEAIGYSVFTYNAGKLIKQEDYDTRNGTPEITFREVITYANGLIDSIVGAYDSGNGILQEFYRNKYVYNTAGNVTRQTTVSWDPVNSTWYSPSTTDYIWSGDLLEQIRFVDLSNPTEYEFGQLYYESFTTGIEKHELAGVDVKAYPNPARNTVTAEVNLQRAQEVTLSLYNITGAKVWSKYTGMQQNIREQIDLSGLPSGLYNLQVATPSGVVSRKVSVIK
jgi:hypothetical protein